MTVTVNRWYAEHTGGTKVYELLLVSDENDRSFVIHRWGPKKSFGNSMKVYDVMPVTRGMNDFRTVMRNKSGRGYQKTKEETLTFDTLEEYKAWNPIVFKKVKDFNPAQHDMVLAALGESAGEIVGNTPVAPDVMQQRVDEKALEMEDWGTW